MQQRISLQVLSSATLPATGTGYRAPGSDGMEEPLTARKKLGSNEIPTRPAARSECSPSGEGTRPFRTVPVKGS